MAPLIFAGILVLRPLLLVPSLWFAPVAAALFGPVLGSLYKLGGETLGASLAFLLARYGLRGAFARGARARADRGFIDRLGPALERRGFRAVVALRVNLLIPFDALNYGLGLTSLRYRHYGAGTLVGIAPGTFLYVWLGDSALGGDWQTLVLALAGIALMVWLSVPLFRDLFPDAPPRGGEPPAR